MRVSKNIITITIFGLLISCTDSKSKNYDTQPVRDNSTEEQSNNENNFEEADGCKFTDGSHTATVEYTNSETGYSQTYTLDVEVEGCEVVQINFPKGGWLDSDHITPAELEKDGSCTIEGENGKTYEIQIDD